MVAVEVLIPDTWGKSSDVAAIAAENGIKVLIPDTWGKSSDCAWLKNSIIFNLLYG